MCHTPWYSKSTTWINMVGKFSLVGLQSICRVKVKLNFHLFFFYCHTVNVRTNTNAQDRVVAKRTKKNIHIQRWIALLRLTPPQIRWIIHWYYFSAVWNLWNTFSFPLIYCAFIELFMNLNCKIGKIKISARIAIEKKK